MFIVKCFFLCLKFMGENIYMVFFGVLIEIMLFFIVNCGYCCCIIYFSVC